MARHRSTSSISAGSRASATPAGASYRRPISGQLATCRTARADAASASTAATRATHHQPVMWAPAGVRPRLTVACRAESSADARPTIAVATRPTATSAPTTASTRRTRPRVTSRTPQHARPARPSAAASGTCPPVLSASVEPALPSGAAQGLPPASAQIPVPATPARTAGPNQRRPSVTGTFLCLDVPDQAVVEAGAGPGVTGRPFLLHLEQDGVPVAVETDSAYPLAMTRGVALGPVLAPAAAPVRRPPGGHRAGQRLVIHPAEHQHLTGVVLLGDRGDEPGVGAGEPGRDSGVEVHEFSLPSAPEPARHLVER